MDLSIIIPEIREAAPAVAANCGGHRTVCLVLEKVDIPQPGNWDKLLGNFDMPGALLFLQSVI